MRIALFVYVVVFLLLNFFVDHPYIFFLATSTFPVTLYLLLRKRKPRTKSYPNEPAHTKRYPSSKQDSF